MSQTVTKEDLQKGLNSVRDSLHADITDLARHFTAALGKRAENVDGKFAQVDGRFNKIDRQFLEVNTKLDAIMSGEILVTRKQVQRLITALETQGMKLNVSEILAA